MSTHSPDFYEAAGINPLGIPKKPLRQPIPLDYAAYTDTSRAGGEIYLEDEELDTKEALKELWSVAFVKLVSTAAANPFQVGQTLLQVQYLPTAAKRKGKEKTEDSHEHGRDYDDDEEEDFYASDSHHAHTTDDSENLSEGATKLNPNDPVLQKHLPSDSMGYLVRTNIYDDSTRPSFRVKPLESGIWDSMGVLVKHPDEGWRSLFKGQFTDWLYEMMQLFLQPSIEGSLNDSFGLYDDAVPFEHLDNAGPNIATLVSSHLIVGVLLSPIELVRTRLIVQTASKKHRKYKGLLDALRTITAEEGLTHLYFGSHLLPTLLYHTLGPLITTTTPLIIERVMGISSEESPILYGLAQFGLSTLELLVTLPLDTIRKRLQLQRKARVRDGRELETVVEVRQAPYSGMIDCAKKMIREEGEKGWLGWRLAPLYRGFSFHFTSNAMLFLLQSVNGVEEQDIMEW
ncbi:uncharacterized protein VTP21DRAFT_770 [Calcarisporiella thermophila]|uniref:uncharacterized protein n=1 Tax=Calcarisporiella thermophila TaxID=911321 RepID=UPI003743BB11